MVSLICSHVCVVALAVYMHMCVFFMCVVLPYLPQLASLSIPASGAPARACGVLDSNGQAALQGRHNDDHEANPCVLAARAHHRRDFASLVIQGDRVLLASNIHQPVRAQWSR